MKFKRLAVGCSGNVYPPHRRYSFECCLSTFSSEEDSDDNYKKAEDNPWTVGDLEKKIRNVSKKYEEFHRLEKRLNDLVMERPRTAALDACFGLVTLPELQVMESEILGKSSARFQELKSAIETCPHWTRKFLPTGPKDSWEVLERSVCGSLMKDMPHDSLNVPFKTPRRPRRDIRVEEAAHVHPKSSNCASSWRALDQCILNTEDPDLISAALYGYKSKDGRVMDGFVNAYPNMHCMQSQWLCYDCRPEVAWLPLVESAEDILACDGTKALDFAVICERQEAYRSIGVNHMEGFTLQNFIDCKGPFIAANDERIRTAFKATAEALSFMVSLGRGQSTLDLPSSSSVKELHEYFEDHSTLQTLTCRDDLDPDPFFSPCPKRMLIVRHSSPLLVLPDSQNDPLRPYPTTDPLFNTARNFNAFLTSIASMGKLKANLNPSDLADVSEYGKYPVVKYYATCVTDHKRYIDCPQCMAQLLLERVPEHGQFLWHVISMDKECNYTRLQKLWAENH